MRAAIPVVWLNFNPDAPNRGYWDQGLLEYLFKGKLWRTGFEYQSFDSLPKDHHGSVVVLPGRQNVQYFDAVQSFINGLSWVLLVITGDEENAFAGESLVHPNMKIWAMTPNPGRYEDARALGSGIPPGMRELLADVGSGNHDPERDLNWFFAGQVTHQRREDCAAVLRDRERGLLLETPGFTQGMEQVEYWHNLTRAKIAPAPGGPVSPDSFRLFEALEAGCVPVADLHSGKVLPGEKDYWNRIFGDALAFLVVENWTEFPSLHSEVLATWPLSGSLASAGWQKYKRDLAYGLDGDVSALSGQSPVVGRVTVLIPTSPIASNPSLDMISETMESIRSRLPDSDVIIMCDGVREEQLNGKRAYDEFVRRLVWKCNTEWTNVLPIVHREHMHQGAMTRHAMDEVRSPTILFVEHDAPLVGDIPFEALVDAIGTGDVNVIRLHHEAAILAPHKYLMLSDKPVRVAGVPLTPTYQWSQRPHLASTEWYRWMVSTYFSLQSRTMIEDLIYGVLETHHREEGVEGWERFKLYIYTPKGDIKRSTHTDGRGDDPKFSMLFDYDDGEIPKWAPHIGVRE